MATEVIDLKSVPGMEKAITFIRGKVAEFRALPQKIRDAQDLAIRLERRAVELNRPQLAAQIQTQRHGLDSLAGHVQGTLGKLGDVLTQLVAAGFGIAPLALAAVVIPVAAAMAYALNTYARTRANLDALARGLLTPEEYAKLQQKGALFNLDLGGALPLIALGVGGWFLLSKGTRARVRSAADRRVSSFAQRWE